MTSLRCRLALLMSLALIFMTAPALLPPVPTAEAATPVSRALAYLRAHQTKAGGFVAGPAAQQPLMTPWCVMAIAAAGQSPTSWRRPGGRDPIAYLQSLDLQKIAQAQTGSSANEATFYAKLILAYSAAGRRSLTARAGTRRIDLVAKLLDFQDSSGRFIDNNADINTTTWAVLALKAAGRAQAPRSRAVGWLKAQAAANGGFSWKQGGAPDTDSTAAAIQALRAGGVASSNVVIRRALAYLRSQQASNGGFKYGFSASTNAESTAWAVQAIKAAGQNPQGKTWRRGGKSGLDYLRRLQAPSGAFYHFGRVLATPLLTTAEAVIALRLRAFPL